MILNHKTTHHQEGPNSFYCAIGDPAIHICEECGKAYSHKHDLENHVAEVHEMINNYRCHICEYASFRQQTLRQHIKAVHEKIKNHKCKICEYAGATATRLKRHIKSVHMNIKA